MDIQLVNTKHFDLYFNTLEFGVGINYVPNHKALCLNLIVFEFVFYLGFKE